jgi:hypothetical protein
MTYVPIIRIFPSSHLPSSSPSQQISHFLLIHADTAGYGRCGAWTLSTSFDTLSQKKDSLKKRQSKAEKSPSIPSQLLNGSTIARGWYDGL